MPGPCLATRDNLNTSTYIEQLSSAHMYRDVSTGLTELAIPGTPYQSGPLQIMHYVPRRPQQNGMSLRQPLRLLATVLLAVMIYSEPPSGAVEWNSHTIVGLMTI